MLTYVENSTNITRRGTPIENPIQSNVDTSSRKISLKFLKIKNGGRVSL